MNKCLIVLIVPLRDFLEYRFTKEDTITKEGFLASEYTGMIEFDESVLQNAKAHLYYVTAQSVNAKSAIKGIFQMQ